MALSLPPSFGLSFTPTIHSKIPPNLDSTTVTLPIPFVVVITGAGKGIGYHMALSFAKAGASGIAISSRTQSDLDQLEAEILSVAQRKDVHVLKSICDTQSDESVSALEASVRATFARVDVVIANAGIISAYVDNASGGSNLPIGLHADADWSRVLNINLLGTWRTFRTFFPLLSTTKSGPQTLICSTSLAAHSTTSTLCPIAYNVSKTACNRLIEHISNDHKSTDGIHAYALHPGAVLTPQTQGHEGEHWGELLGDEVGLAGAMCVWLGREKRGWLSGRYVSANWDVGELEGRRGEIEERDLLKFRMAV